MNYKSFADLSIDINNNLFKLNNEDYDLIVGIPRSGMIPAYMIGLYLNVHVTSLDSFINNEKLTSGVSRNTKMPLVFAMDAQKILLVDDSIVTGKAMQLALARIPNNIKESITTCAIYSDKKNKPDIDIYLEYVKRPRVFEWNIFHARLMKNACLDIDGVLCIDPTEDENDDGDNYIHFMLNAKPLHIPSTKIKALVTSRLEKYRPQTEQWLNAHNIQYDELIMLDLPSKKERQKLGLHAEHKAAYYKKSGLDLFVESAPTQALAIMTATGKPVFCTDNNQMYAPNISRALIKSPTSLLKQWEHSIAIKLPVSLKRIIKPIYTTLLTRN
ncbi:phosphoribosyltransferase family protein [Psychrobacter sp. 1Y11]|uniref:phosphoribosyltransferase family protein n=1 Tax=Psychrobacter sp. 1Y11 TaxID=3457446 RepID=UPI003FD31D72